jgi:hypothetical protein
MIRGTFPRAAQPAKANGRADSVEPLHRSRDRNGIDFPAHDPTSFVGGLMIKIAITAGIFVLAVPAMAQETAPSTWRDPNTQCIYFKVGDTLSLRYRRDGMPDCANVQRDTSDETITRTDFRELTRAIEALRRDIGDVRRVMADMGRNLEDIRRQSGSPPAR